MGDASIAPSVNFQLFQNSLTQDCVIDLCTKLAATNAAVDGYTAYANLDISGGNSASPVVAGTSADFIVEFIAPYPADGIEFTDQYSGQTFVINFDDTIELGASYAYDQNTLIIGINDSPAGSDIANEIYAFSVNGNWWGPGSSGWNLTQTDDTIEFTYSVFDQGAFPCYMSYQGAGSPSRVNINTISNGSDDVDYTQPLINLGWTVSHN